MMARQNDEYIPSKEEQDDDDDEISNYQFMAKDQSEKVINFDSKNFMSYDGLQTTLNQLMNDFHKILKHYFSISNEKVD